MRGLLRQDGSGLEKGVRISRRRLLAMASATAMMGGVASAGQAVEPGALEKAQAFFDGRTIRAIIPAGAGSGSDRSARQFLDAVRRFLPSARLRVENHDRAGGQIGASELWRAQGDGLTIGFPRSNLFYAELLHRETLDFSLADFTFFGSMTRAHRVMVLRNDAEARDIDDVLTGRSVVLKSADSVTSSHYYEALLMNALTGSRIRPVPGYAGGARNMAVINGEVSCQIGTLEAVQPILDTGVAKIVFRLSSAPLPAGMPEVPRLADHLRDPNLAWAVDVIDAVAALGRPVAGPPEIEPEAKAYWLTLFDAITADPIFREDARKADGMVIDPADGQTITALLAGLTNGRSGLQNDLEALLDCGQSLANGEAGSCG
jgi:tripartite-type tricarboxylate transporter receptor subunit TctC